MHLHLIVHGHTRASQSTKCLKLLHVTCLIRAALPVDWFALFEDHIHSLLVHLLMPRH